MKKKSTGYKKIDEIIEWQLTATDDEKIAYMARLKHILDEQSMIVEAELRIKEARKQGLEEGREKGKKEAAKMLAKKMLEQELSLDLIKEVTGLDEEEMRKLIS
ncbi:hypothetical protein M3212_05005 [Alkalihalobacillus oceani]|uniref:hypothetical protein n=1 Tax=Halalkalibacter oceani TaxID=1653776 RepID=UPI00203FD597|nr:hypothetical protein [Halalkalibacter oceani]MCM3760147.1 hypothetical protein [Halalkalibacter oceani]